jgi:serine/threonine-protein kinase
LADACEGLHAAHEACDDSGQPLDVVHRDVAPDNLFLTYDGVVKVVDFGVAKVARGRHRTRTGIIKGKMDYIAPELLRGARADRRADIWGLGAVLWEMLTLRRLFRRSTDVATLGAVLGMDITPPSKVRTGLPKELDAIVMRALARSPGERYATARDMGRDLVRFLAQRGEAVGNADLSDWMDQIFPGGRSVSRQLLQIASRPGTDEAVSCVRQAAWHGVDSSSCSGPSPSLPPPLSLPPPRRRWHVGLLVAALIAALAGLAVAVVGQTRRSHGPAIAEPSKEPPAPGPISPTAAPLDPRQPLVLEVAATRESGERHTLFRIRSAPGGDLVVDDSAPGAAPDSTGVRPAHK